MAGSGQAPPKIHNETVVEPDHPSLSLLLSRPLSLRAYPTRNRFTRRMRIHGCAEVALRKKVPRGWTLCDVTCVPVSLALRRLLSSFSAATFWRGARYMLLKVRKGEISVEAICRRLVNYCPHLHAKVNSRTNASLMPSYLVPFIYPSVWTCLPITLYALPCRALSKRLRAAQTWTAAPSSLCRTAAISPSHIYPVPLTAQSRHMRLQY